MLKQLNIFIVSLIFCYLIRFSVGVPNCSEPIDFKKAESCCAVPKGNMEPFKKQCPTNIIMSPCFLECFYREMGLLDGNKVNLINVRKLVKQMIINNPSYQDIAIAGFESCGSQVDDFNKILKRRQASTSTSTALFQSKKNCTMLPMMITMCIRKYVFSHCPISGWTNDAFCNNAKERAIYCKMGTKN